MRSLAVTLLVLTSLSAAAADGKILGHLVSKGTKITLISARGELVYTLRDATGRMLAERIDEQRLAADFPRLYERMKSSLARPEEHGLRWAGM